MQTQKRTAPSPIARPLSAPATIRPTTGHNLPDPTPPKILQSPQKQKLAPLTTMESKLHTTPHHDIV